MKPIKLALNGKEINLTSDDININSTNFKVDKNGNLTCKSASLTDILINDGEINLQDTGEEDVSPVINIKSTDNSVISEHRSWGSKYKYYDDYAHITENGFVIGNENGTGMFTNILRNIWMYDDGQGTVHFQLIPDYCYIRDIRYDYLSQRSLEKIKKNIEKYNGNVIDIIKNSEIYEYNLKTENDNHKKHIGFVIGNKYKTPKEITNNDESGIDIYSMSSIMWRAIQEQQETIENQQKTINDLIKRIERLEEK